MAITVMPKHDAARLELITKHAESTVKLKPENRVLRDMLWLAQELHAAWRREDELEQSGGLVDILREVRALLPTSEKYKRLDLTEAVKLYIEEHAPREEEHGSVPARDV